MDHATLTLIADKHIRAALAEDMDHGDISTYAVMPHARAGAVDLIAKQDGIIAGLDVFEHTFHILDPKTRCEFMVSEGDRITNGQLLATIHGDIRVLLSGERTALNYLQRMSGIATATRAIVDMLAGSSTTLVDTRKTTPGMRIFEKAAVLAGGATNHRFNLSDSVMLKDNHIAAAGGITQAVRAARDVASFTSMIEVECETLDQVQEALNAGADIIMLDNMDIPTMQNAVALIGEFALTECSGNVTAERIEALRDLSVNFISCGALTHSAGILDVSMKHLREE